METPSLWFRSYLRLIKAAGLANAPSGEAAASILPVNRLGKTAPWKPFMFLQTIKTAGCSRGAMDIATFIARKRVRSSHD